MRHGNASEILFFLSTFFLSVFRDQGSGIRRRCVFGGLTETIRTEKRGINIQGFGCGENAISDLGRCIIRSVLRDGFGGLGVSSFCLNFFAIKVNGEVSSFSEDRQKYGRQKYHESTAPEW